MPKPRMKLHIWRYDANMPTEQEPWIVSIFEDDTAQEEPPCFRTFGEAVAALPDIWRYRAGGSDASR